MRLLNFLHLLKHLRHRFVNEFAEFFSSGAINENFGLSPRHKDATSLTPVVTWRNASATALTSFAYSDTTQIDR